MVVEFSLLLGEWAVIGKPLLPLLKQDLQLDAQGSPLHPRTWTSVDIAMSVQESTYNLPINGVNQIDPLMSDLLFCVSPFC